MRALFILILSFVSQLAIASGATLSAVGGSFSKDSGRLELTLDGPAKFSSFTLEKPHRLVVDLKETRLKAQLPRRGIKGTPVTKVRHGYRDKGAKLRLVFELDRPLKSKLKRKGNRLVAHLSAARKVVKRAPPPKPVRTIKQVAKAAAHRDVVVAIDAGHGGKDVGAEGPNGIYEKDVVLAVARKLKRLIDRERGMKAVLIRNGDRFLRLRTRINKARDSKADLFISLHANSFSDPKVRGASVYVLSNRGASSEAARWLAKKENDADLIGGVSLDEQQDGIGAVLLDLAQNATLEDSIVAAGEVLGQFKRNGKVHKRGVERAGFLVLKSPDIPSMLVELAFISNPDEERKLNSSRHQSRMARSLLGGVRGYFAKNAPPGTLLAEQNRKKRKQVSTAGRSVTGG